MYAVQVKYAPNGCGMKKGCVFSAGTSTKGSLSEVSDNLSTMLTDAPPKQQKQILGDHLYPLISEYKVSFFSILYNPPFLFYISYPMH